MNWRRKLAESITFWIGTWVCVFCFLGFECIWMLLNSVGVFHIDPAPFILLNLVLSTWAGIQSSLIMINQKYQQQIADDADKKRDIILMRLLENDEKNELILSKLLEMEQAQQNMKGIFSKWLK